jgi:hypothetical protein
MALRTLFKRPVKRLLRYFDTTSTVQYKRVVAHHNGIYYVFHVQLEEPSKWDGRAKFVVHADLRRALHNARLIQPEDGAIMFTCTGSFI